jgi:NAD(P)H-dependent FMN reductase
MYIPIILGTAREGRQSEKAANFLLEQTRNADFESEIIDVRDFRIPATNNTEEIPEAKKLEAKITKTDAIIIVSPEYNHGYPGELKMMLDMLFKQFFNKPLGICGVSSGGLGGARMVEQMRQVAIAFHMLPINGALYFSNVQDLFDDEGKIKDEAYIKRAQRFFEELKSAIL